MILLVLLAFLGLNQALKVDNGEIMQFTADCGVEAKVDISKFGPDEEANIELFQDHDFRCFAKCLSVKMRHLNEDFEPKVESLKEMFEIEDDEDLIESWKKCVEENNQEDNCDKAYERHLCVMKKIKEIKGWK